MSTILCTGGAGFIASHLTDRLVSLGHKVVVLDNLSTGTLDNLNCDFEEFVHRDINENLDDLFQAYQFSHIFHFAAQINLRKSFEDPILDAQTNIIGSLNIIKYAVKYNVKIIFASSGGSIYDEWSSLPFDEHTLTKPKSPYGLAKLTVEKYLEIAKNKYGLNYVALRYSNVYGPRQNDKSEAGVISIFKRRAQENKDLIIFGDGKQTRDFIYIDDVVDANILTMNEDIVGIFNVSANWRISINTIANIILKKVNSKSRIIYEAPIVGEMIHCKLSYDLFNEKTNWKPKVNITDGIDKLFREQRK